MNTFIALWTSEACKKPFKKVLIFVSATDEILESQNDT